MKKALILFALLAALIPVASAQQPESFGHKVVRTIEKIVSFGSYGKKETVAPATCGPPLYSCDYTGTDIVLPQQPLFSATDPVNTVKTSPVLSKVRYLRATSGLAAGIVFNSTPSGGDYDHVFNKDSTMFEVKSDGNNFAVGFNPTAFQVYPTSTLQPAVKGTYVSGTKCPGAAEFSTVSNVLWYCLPEYGEKTPLGTIANGTTIYAVTFSYDMVNDYCGSGVGKCPDVYTPPTWTEYFDFLACPFAGIGKPLSRTILSVGINDEDIGNGISWTGDQGTAHLWFHLDTKSRVCSTFDTQGNGVNPAWYLPTYRNGQANYITSVMATWFLHEATSNGDWASFSPNNCVGSSCPSGAGPLLWKINTSDLNVFPAGSGNASGHDAMGLSYFYNAGNPAINSHPFTNLALYTQVANLNCSPCQENHFNADMNSNLNPLIGADAGPNETWTVPYKNEIYLLPTSAGSPIIRVGPTYETGTNKGNFWANYAIGAPDQLRKHFAYSSDQLCNLGKTSAGDCAEDVFIVELSPVN